MRGLQAARRLQSNQMLQVTVQEQHKGFCMAHTMPNVVGCRVIFGGPRRGATASVELLWHGHHAACGLCSDHEAGKFSLVRKRKADVQGVSKHQRRPILCTGTGSRQAVAGNYIC